MVDKPNVLILSGFLGSGKTTILLQLVSHLRAKYGEDYTIAIIENEIGSASVDSGIIADAGYSVTEMLSGCICCTLVGELIPSLDKLSQELNPNLVILEATGMATPDTMRDMIVKHSSYACRIVVLVDASRWLKVLRAVGTILERQTQAADIICINKCDLADAEQLAEVERTVREFNAAAPLVFTSACAPIDGDDLDRVVGE